MFHQIYKLQFISKISRAYITFCSMMLKSISFCLTVANRTSNGRIDFSLQLPEFTATYSLKSEKGWPVDFAKL